MDFRFDVVRLWERPTEELLAGELGVVPLAVLGRLPEKLSQEDGLAAVAQRIVQRIRKDAAPDLAAKLLTEAVLLTGLRVKRDVAVRVFQGAHVMEESDTYLMIFERGEERRAKKDILLFGEERLGPPSPSIRSQLEQITDLARLDRMIRRAVKADGWNEIIETP